MDAVGGKMGTHADIHRWILNEGDPILVLVVCWFLVYFHSRGGSIVFHGGGRSCCKDLCPRLSRRTPIYVRSLHARRYCGAVRLGVAVVKMQYSGVQNVTTTRDETRFSCSELDLLTDDLPIIPIKSAMLQ